MTDTEPDGAGRGPRHRGRRATRITLAASTVLACVVMAAWVVVAADTLVVSDYNVGWVDALLAFSLGIWVLAAAGVLWAVPAVVAIRMRPLRMRLLLVPPLVVVGGLALCVTLLHDDFASSTAELDALADEVAAQPVGWTDFYGIEHPRRAGRAEISVVRHGGGGVVSLPDADCAIILGECGWIRTDGSPPELPRGAKDPEVERLTETWFRYSYSY